MATARHIADSHHFFFMASPNLGGRQLSQNEADVCLKYAKLKKITELGKVWVLPTRQLLYEIFNKRSLKKAIH